MLVNQELSRGLHCVLECILPILNTKKPGRTTTLMTGCPQLPPVSSTREAPHVPAQSLTRHHDTSLLHSAQPWAHVHKGTGAGQPCWVQCVKSYTFPVLVYCFTQHVEVLGRNANPMAWSPLPFLELSKGEKKTEETITDLKKTNNWTHQRSPLVYFAHPT